LLATYLNIAQDLKKVMQPTIETTGRLGPPRNKNNNNNNKITPKLLKMLSFSPSYKHIEHQEHMSR